MCMQYQFVSHIEGGPDRPVLKISSSIKSTLHQCYPLKMSLTFTVFVLMREKLFFIINFLILELSTPI